MRTSHALRIACFVPALLFAGSLPAAPGDFRRGDSDADGTVNITDAVRTLGFLFQGLVDPPCVDAADADDSGFLNITDAIFTLGFLFLGGDPIPPPGTMSCGPDPSADALGCAAYEPCAVSNPDDLDGDGLLNDQETVGWTIFVDDSGLGQGNVQSRRVTSDPALPDTDGDGLGDLDEFLLRTDPRRRDTDGDDLEDREEVERWETNPNSVDSDGDSRGPNHDLQPSSIFFDGLETRFVGTSPSLEDTDGDGLTDFE
jgi:hypothetical protein